MCIRELSYHGLQIYLRVPIWIIKNNHISSCQINSKTSSSSTQHENEFTAVRSIKCVNCFLKEKKKVSLKYQIFQTSFQYVGGFPNKFILNLHHFHIKKNFIKVRNVCLDRWENPYWLHNILYFSLSWGSNETYCGLRLGKTFPWQPFQKL